MQTIRNLIFTSLLISSPALAQQNTWTKNPADQWPSIAMINEVWYESGEQYVHPSFEYVATGFLVDIGSDTVAVTVKHALWVAKMKSMTTVDLRKLKRWIMHPKGNLQDSVVIDHLINEDTTEILSGARSTITQRDWLVFKTKFRSPNIQPLQPRYSEVKPGERIFFSGCPYSEKYCLSRESSVIAMEGDRIILSTPSDFNLGGFSGSPIIDENGFLIGILGGSSIDRKTGAGALYGISTRYFKDVLDNKKHLNVSLIPVDEVLRPLIDKKGIDAGVKKLRQIASKRENYFKYDFSAEVVNGIGDDYMERGKFDWAVEIYKASIELIVFENTYVKLADAYLRGGNVTQAKDIYSKILERWPQNTQALKVLKTTQ